VVPLQFGDEPGRPDIAIDEAEAASVGENLQRHGGEEKRENDGEKIGCGKRQSILIDLFQLPATSHFRAFTSSQRQLSASAFSHVWLKFRQDCPVKPRVLFHGGKSPRCNVLLPPGKTLNSTSDPPAAAGAFSQPRGLHDDRRFGFPCPRPWTYARLGPV
jgi:hypothetical protein